MNVETDPVDRSDGRYHQLADAVLSSIESHIDRWLQNDTIDIDAQRTGGMLELTFPNNSKIVVNKQPPLQEIWLAARSGGYHYKVVDGRWMDARENKEFFDALSACASAQAGQTLRFDPPA